MDTTRLQMLTKNKAHINEQAATQISTLWACKTEHFFLPMAPGAVPTVMPAQVPPRWRTNARHRGRRANIQVQAPSEIAGVGRYVKVGRTGPWLEGSSARTVGRRRETQGRAAFRGSEGEGAEDQEHERGRFPPVMGMQGGVVW